MDLMYSALQPYFIKYKSRIIGSILLVLVIAATSFINLNDAEITNGMISAHIYMPDAVNGYYRGVRFDRSGIIGSLTYQQHSYFGQWFKTYIPTKDDAIMGPVEAFDPVGYNEAKTGGSFIKIGVGVLLKPDSLPYSFSKPYQLINAGKWTKKGKGNEIQFTHTLVDSTYSYQYVKSVKLVKNQPLLTISHTLKNTGSRTIQTQVFDHNFFVIDNQPTGPGFMITFPFELNKILNKKPDYVTLQGNQLKFIKELDNQFVSFTDLTAGAGCDTYDLKIENHNTGAAVRITADKPISKMVFWSAAKTLCPEPYINIRIDPGEIFSWTITYQFYTCNIIKS